MDIKELFTFDDVLLVPRVSRVSSRKDVDTSSNLTPEIRLSIPIMSSNMDTVTEAVMAIAMAKNGGVGAIHRFSTIEEEAEQVRKVKREQSAVIGRPYSVSPYSTFAEIKKFVDETNITSFPVVDRGKLVGIITKRDFQFEKDEKKLVKDLMTKDVITARVGISIQDAKKILTREKIEKLPLLDSKGKLVGMMTAKDIRIAESYSNASKDKNGRLIVGASVGIGSDYLERTKALIEAEADFIVVDVANGYLQKTADAVRSIKKTFNVQVIAGNVATKEGVENLKRAGADSIKVGIGPGGACLTRTVAGVGYPQLSAIIECSKSGIPIIADGGITKSADFAKAMAGCADIVMIGSLIAGTDESPGSIVTKSNSNYKFYRGMASVNAFASKALKLDEDVDIGGYTPEGTEMLIPYKGSAIKIINNLVGGLRSAMTYLGAANIEEFRKNARFVKLTEAGKRESKYL
ncbi:IMP dehydrogenase [Candidatus Parvarchaeota archaeon]|nr:IMP dehydrogenase [Candidatus Parvarchaeota archaeon]